jgi:hypothetical protein
MGKNSQDVDKARILAQDTNNDKTGMRNSTTAVRQGLTEVRQELPAKMSTEIISVVATVIV